MNGSGESCGHNVIEGSVAYVAIDFQVEVTRELSRLSYLDR